MKLSALLKRFTAIALALGVVHAAPAQADKIRLGYAPTGLTLGYGAVLEANNFFKDLGVDVEYVHFAEINGPIRALAANAIDIAFGSPAAGAFSLTSDGVPVSIILATQPANVIFVVPEDSPIQSLADLKGKKLASSPSGSSTASIASAILKLNHGIGPNDFSLVPGNEGRLVQFLAQKDADAAALRNVTVAQLKDLKVRQLATFADEWKKLTGGNSAPYNAVGIVRNDLLNKHPEVVAKVVAGLRKGLEFGRDNPAEVVRIVQKAANLPADQAQVYADLWNENYRVSFTPDDIDTLKREFEVFKESGVLKGDLPASAFNTGPYEKSLTIK